MNYKSIKIFRDDLVRIQMIGKCYFRKFLEAMQDVEYWTSSKRKSSKQINKDY